jgi:hypothetical protein
MEQLSIATSVSGTPNTPKPDPLEWGSGFGESRFSCRLFDAPELNGESVMTPQEFEGAFPAVLDWIQQTLLAHKSRARPIASKKFKRLPLYFSEAQIQATKFVIVERVPVPPLSSFGLFRFKEFERGDYDVITYLDTYFLKRSGAGNESLHFHEMIHIVQWRVFPCDVCQRLGEIWVSRQSTGKDGV